MGTRMAALQDSFVNYTLNLINQGILNHEFNNLLLLQNHTNPGFVANKLNEFFQSTQEHLDNLAQILEQEKVDFSNLDQILHGFKDINSTIGAERILSECVQFRINSHAKDKEGCLRCLERTRMSYNQLKSNLETLLGMENRIVQADGSIPKLPINEKTGTKVAQYQFEYVDYTSTLMDEYILITEINPKYEAHNLNVALRDVTRRLDNLAEFVEELNDNMNFDFHIDPEIARTMRFINTTLDSSRPQVRVCQEGQYLRGDKESELVHKLYLGCQNNGYIELTNNVGAVSCISLRGALKKVRDYYKERNMEKCLESMNKAKNEFNSLKSRLEPIMEMEKKIVDAGGSIPKPIVKDTRRIGALHPSHVFIIGVDVSWNVGDRD